MKSKHLAWLLSTALAGMLLVAVSGCSAPSSADAPPTADASPADAPPTTDASPTDAPPVAEETPTWQPTFQQSESAVLELPIINALTEYDSHNMGVAWDVAANKITVTIFSNGDEIPDSVLADMQARAEELAHGIPVVVVVFDGWVKVGTQLCQKNRLH